MSNDRMMQAMGRIERAIGRLEAAAQRQTVHARQQSQEIARLTDGLDQARRENDELREREQALRQETGRPSATVFPEQDPHAMNAFSHDKALAALRSLDTLIDDLQKARRDG
jgi:hypothetical protein